MQHYDPEDLLRLMAHVVVADNRVFDEEIEAFVACAIKLNVQSESGAVLSQPVLEKWFTDNRDSIFKTAEQADVNRVLTDLFINLRPAENKEEILEVMCSIAKADGHFHINEKLLIALASGHWGMRAPIWSETDNGA